MVNERRVEVQSGKRSDETPQNTENTYKRVILVKKGKPYYAGGTVPRRAKEDIYAKDRDAVDDYSSC